MKKLPSLAATFLFLAALPISAQTGTWTAVGSTGVIDESSTAAYQFVTTNLTYNAGGAVTPIVARYNVTNTWGVSDTPPWNTLEMGYLDTTPQVSVTAVLYQVDPCTGNQVVLCTVVSSDAGGPTCKICQFTPPINFATRLYYVQVTLARTAVGVTPPNLYTLRVY